MNRVHTRPRGPRPEDDAAAHEQTRRRVYAAFLEAEGAPEDPGEWGVVLGAAGAYLKQHGVYERVFEHGLSLANPSDHLECVVLPHAYRDLDGVEHTSICLPPHSGDVLIDAEDGSPG